MKNNRWRSCLLIATVLVMFKSIEGFGQDFSDNQVAVLVTEAELKHHGKGRVLGYFPQALMTRDPLRKTRGFFIFDSGEQRLERTQVPLEIKYERGERVFDEKEQKWKETKPEKFEYSLNNSSFLPKLIELLGENKVSLSADFVPTEPFTGLISISSGKNVSRFLLKDGTEVSVLVEIGERQHLEAEHKKLSVGDEAAQLALYEKHFKNQPFQIKIYRLRPGHKPSNPRTVQGIAFARHRHESKTGGRILINQGPEEPTWSMLVSELSINDKQAQFSLPAEEFLSKVIAPLISADPMTPDSIQCVIGEEEEATLCKKSEKGAVVLKGNLGAAEPQTFVVEKQGVAAGDYQDLFRVELIPERKKD